MSEGPWRGFLPQICATEFENYQPCYRYEADQQDHSQESYLVSTFGEVMSQEKSPSSICSILGNLGGSFSGNQIHLSRYLVVLELKVESASPPLNFSASKNPKKL
jgi:hypothetical protein